MSADKHRFSPASFLGPIPANYPAFHFSVDDVFDCLVEVSDKNIPLFEHPIFVFFNEMHTKYGLYIDLYLFFQKEINGKLRNLSEIRDIRDELAAAGGWLRFGPHAFDYGTMPFDQTEEQQRHLFDMIYAEIDRFAGKENYAKVVRLHFYSELFELADYFAARGVISLFSTDRDAGSYRMPTEIGTQLFMKGDATYNGMHFIRTQFRLEFFTRDNFQKADIEKAFKEALKQYGYIIFYTHEIELSKKEIQVALDNSLEILKSITI